LALFFQINHELTRIKHHWSRCLGFRISGHRPAIGFVFSNGINRKRRPERSRRRPLGGFCVQVLTNKQFTYIRSFCSANSAFSAVKHKLALFFQIDHERPQPALGEVEWE
jgi:hypothetical protein